MEMDIVFNASIIAAFFAGMVALFAPCCITVLLPSYLASAFRAKKHVLKMTFVFFAGITIVLLPIGLGAAGLAKFFRDFHKEMYVIGGVLMLIFGVMSVLGKGMSIVPMNLKAPNLNVLHAKSVFILGIFSGAATSCCAPVLAGAVTLAVLTASFWKALIVTFAYIFGMIFPLFLAAYFYDRFDIADSKFIKGKLLTINAGSRKIYVHSTNIFAGVVFFAMGFVLVYLAFSGNVFWAPSFQVQIGEALARWSTNTVGILSRVPNLVWGLVVAGIFGFFLYKIARKKDN